MDPGKVIEFSKRADIDVIMEDFYVENNEQVYIRMKKELLRQGYTAEWILMCHLY